ncbi:MAG: sulfatase [Verrucomicrobia bacterium]|nr:sulfatase [Verrucomicrobiota bacterium]
MVKRIPNLLHGPGFELCRRIALFHLLLAALGLHAQTGAGAQQQPNVLLIFADDLNCRLGTYGDAAAMTPHIDALASAGMRFDRAYCANPVCLPSRTAILTGLRPETTQVLNNNAGCFRKYVPDAVTLPQLFARGGYQVASVGKTFYSHRSDDTETDKIMERLPTDGARWPGANALLIGAEEKDALKTKLGQRQTFWGPLDVDDAALPDGQSARAAAKFLKEGRSKPFFLAVGIFRPHLPFIAPKKYFDLHPLGKIILPAAAAGDSAGAEAVDLGLPHAVRRMERERGMMRLAMEDETRRQMIQAYYACVSFADAQVGVVLAALEEAGLKHRTIIVFVSDHGFLLGEHGAYAKSSLYEQSVRAPLIVSAPGVTQPGRPCARLVEFVDLYPSLAELCGLKAPEGLEGTSFVPLLKNPQRPWKKAVFSVDMVGERMVRTEKWKLITLPGGGGMLFDLERDAEENQNLHESPSHQKPLAEMRALHSNGWRKAAP